MKAYYEITTVLKDALLEDDFVNTVTKGGNFDVDIVKQTIFPLSHIIVPNIGHEGATLRFTIEILLLDVEDVANVQTNDYFRGNNNTDDIHNTQLAVGVRLVERLRRGDLFNDNYQLDGDPNYEDITMEYENGLSGWRLSLDILYKHDMTVC